MVTDGSRHDTVVRGVTQSKGFRGDKAGLMASQLVEHPAGGRLELGDLTWLSLAVAGL